MKISVVTISYGKGAALKRTYASVHSQRLPAGVTLDHILVVSDRDFDASAYPEARVVYVPADGCYRAMNAGLALCSGDVIGLLHGGDVYAADNVLVYVADAFADGLVDFVYGDLYYSRRDGTGCSRFYSSAKFTPERLSQGFAPPHPTLFVRRAVARELGPYDTDYLVASDFDYFIRLYDHRPAYKGMRIDKTMVCMEPGGLSNSWRNRLWFSNLERYKALKKNRGHASFLYLLRRYYYHFFQ